MDTCTNCGLAQPPDMGASCARCGAPLRASAATEPTVVPASRPPSSSDRTVLRAEGASEPTVVAGAAPGASTPPLRTLGPYEILSELGHGGMGVVWKAFDTRLRRVVALKGILSAGDAQADQVQRFMREAQAAARLRHPNIVAVHDVGVVDDQHYFTCDYIEGRSLDAVEKPLPARRAMELVKAIAEALQYAHDQGIVHRDVKPANVLVDAAGKPYIMDFGLAKDVKEMTGSGLTMSGDLLGTPAYMSPEQARGSMEEVGPASDQFSVGSLLYELLTGSRPFEAESLHGLLGAILDQEPVRPTSKNPKVQRDVETICLKAMEKDPGRRYATIGALAADAGRWLEGEPIEARPESGIRRVLRRAARHRWVVLSTCATVILGLAFGVYALVSARRTTQAEEKAASALGTLEKSRLVSAVFARWTRLLPALGRMEAVTFDSQVPAAEVEARTAQDWRAVQEFIEATPSDSASQATMRALAGWARCLAGRREEGAEWMARAASIDAEVPFGDLMAALSLLGEYVERQTLPRAVATPFGLEFEGEAPETERQAALRERFELLLARAQGAKVWGREGAKDFEDVVAGARALGRGDPATAEAALTRALGSPDLRAFATWLLYARAKARYARKDFDGAIADIDEVLAARPGYQVVLSTRGSFHVSRGAALAARGQDPTPAFQAALDALEKARAHQPDDRLSIAEASFVWQQMGMALDKRGEDPREAYAKALACAEEAVRVDAGDADARAERGNARRLAAEEAILRGEDAREACRAAIEDYGEALRLDPECLPALTSRGSAWRSLGDAEAALGADPRESYAKAIADLDQAVSRSPSSPRERFVRGNAWKQTAAAEKRRGGDPRGALAKAIEDQTQAIALSPQAADAYVSRAMARGALGDAIEAAGEDPRPAWRDGLDDLAKAIAIDPSASGPYVQQGNLLALLAARDEDPRPGLAEAIARYDEGVKRNPADDDAWYERGRVRLELAGASAERGEDPLPIARTALAELEKAATLRPSRTVAPCAIGWAHLEIARHLATAGEEPSEELRRAIAAYGEVVGRAPSCVDALYGRATGRLRLGKLEADEGIDPRPEFRGAAEDYGAALAVRADDLGAASNGALAWMWLANAQEAFEEDPAAAYEKALAATDAALRIDPGRWQTHLTRGGILGSLGRAQEAVRCMEEALRLSPGNPTVEAALGQMKARLAPPRGSER